MTDPTTHDAVRRPARPASWTPWRAVLAFGMVSLAADMVYEGMRSVAGPYLGSLGASALTVGVVTGAGEAVALVLRLATGAWADHSHRHWRLTVVGYAMTAVCVPLLAVAPFVGAAGVALASVLILLERTGKAVRSPAKSALLARMATRTGRGRGFAVQKALDQVGAFAGPLVVAGAAALTGRLWLGLAVLAVPGVISMLLLAQLCRRVPSVAEPDPEDTEDTQNTQNAQDPHDPQGQPRPDRSRLSVLRAALGTDLPPTFHRFALAVALATAGLMTFGVISYRLVDAGLVSASAVPLVYTAAMAAEAVAALAIGDLFDRWGPGVLLAVPLLVCAVPALVLSDQLWVVVVGIVIWGAATGVQDSTVKAHIAGLVAARRRATAYGVFAAVQGIGALVGGALAGALIVHHGGLLVAGVVVVQVASLVLLATTLRADRAATRAD